jgi:hypothetical protein
VVFVVVVLDVVLVVVVFGRGVQVLGSPVQLQPGSVWQN